MVWWLWTAFRLGESALTSTCYYKVSRSPKRPKVHFDSLLQGLVVLECFFPRRERHEVHSHLLTIVVEVLGDDVCRSLREP